MLRLTRTRRYSSKPPGLSPKPIISIPAGSNIYPFGAPSQTRTPLISKLAWTVHEGEAWAVVSGTGGGGKGAIFKTLLGHNRLAAATPDMQGRWAESGGLYPFLSSSSSSSPPVDPYTRVSFVSFRQRTGAGGDSGAFFDYTARYGAMREEEDKVTVRDSLKASIADAGDNSEHSKLFKDLTERIGLKSLLDLPMITLSNGQTRRARVVKAILDKPELLLLDEPLTGLDPPSRKALTETLQQLHHDRAPRIIIGLRKGEEIPPWITHILEVEGGTAHTRKASSSSKSISQSKPEGANEQEHESPQALAPATQGALLVDMKNVNVSYGDRKVLKNISWQIRQGERWHLQGANGSGKTTLLALLTGDHPQSYTQAHLLLPSLPSLPSLCTSSPQTTPVTPEPPSSPYTPTPSTPSYTLQHRKRTPTAHLRQLIGVVSPEMFDAFPRRHPGMSVWEAVTTGFDGGFVPRTKGANANANTEQTQSQKMEKGEITRKGAVGWVDVGDDELGFGLDEDGGKAEREKRRESIRKWRIQRCWAVLEALGPASWSQPPLSPLAPPSPTETEEFASTPFSSLPPGTQRLVLLMRALVGRPPLVLLDEVWSGMSEEQVEAARRYLRNEGAGTGVGASESENGEEGIGKEQAVVVVTHWEGEVPWVGEEVRRFKLE